MLETQREQLYNQQMNMEQTSFAVQNMQDNIAQVRAMKAANKDLKGAFRSKELNIDNIERMNDDMADMMVSPKSFPFPIEGRVRQGLETWRGLPGARSRFAGACTWHMPLSTAGPSILPGAPRRGLRPCPGG